MKRYESYKDSGQQWLGKIPSHWNMKRLRLLLIENTCNDFNEHTNILLQFKYGEIVRKPNQYESIEEATAIGNYTKVAPQDIMINGLNLNYDFISQRVAQVKESGIITAAYISLRPTVLADSKYYTYLLKSMDAKKMFHGMGRGIRLTLSYNELKNHFIPYPPKNEQNIIVAYLDKTTSEIDKAIAQQQRMIDLLNERKQIIIQQAVTKGLNPNSKMKNSGVEWIGQVPEHWEIMRLKRCAAVKTGCTPSTKELKYYESQDINWFTPEDIGNDRICEAQKKVSYIAKQEGACKVFPSHIVYFVGIGASIGKVSYCDIEASANQQINAIIPNHRVNYKFLSYCLKTQKEEIFLTANTVTLPIINQERTGSLLIPIPPLFEQQQIIDHIEKQIACIDKAIAKQQQTIDLLKERKQIVINDAVTGKIKVI